MEFKSQICTTKEQSDRLLKIGLRRETADCVITSLGQGDRLIHTECPITVTEGLNSKKIPNYTAWSLHRLMEIADTNSIDSNASIGFYDGFYDEIIAHIQSLIHLGYIKEEYLDMDIVNANEDKNVELLKNGGVQ